jgi:class 3 adenylate cyclase/DNA-binding NarL/FixJ family response regulator
MGVGAADLPGGTVTFLFTDIEGSTRMLKQLGERYAEVLLGHQRVLREAFEAAAGREVDTQGDAFFIVFPRAKDAVAGALAAQRELRRESWPDGVEVRVRMAMHTGEPALAGERYIGLGVHRAARICAAGHGGQVLLSQSSYSVLVDDVLPDIDFRDLGDHRLKDLDRPERIYQLVVPDLPAEFPPLKTLGQVTPEAIPFAGREQELVAGAAAALSRDAVRVVVADDSVLLREGLCRLLEDSGFEVVGRAADAEELLREVAATQPTVAITDIKMPPTHTDEGLVAAQQIRAEYPEMGVLVLSQYLDSRYAMRLLEEFPERVGYLLKERVSDVAVLADAIRRVVDGETVIDPTIVSRLMKRQRGAGPVGALPDEDRELLALVAEGLGDEAIAHRLGLDPPTVAERVGELFRTFGLEGKPDEVRRVLSVLTVLRS